MTDAALLHEARSDIARRCPGAPPEHVEALLERVLEHAEICKIRVSSAVNAIFDARERRAQGWPAFFRSIKGGRR